MLVVLALLSRPAEADDFRLYAYMQVHGQALTQADAYHDAWGVAEEHMQFLGYQYGEIVSEVYTFTDPLWNCAMTVRCRGEGERGLDVFSPLGEPTPSTGEHLYAVGSSIACTVDSPVGNGTTRSVCTGWTGTGSVPVTGSGSSTGTFELTDDSSCTWHWQVEYRLETERNGEGTLSADNQWQQAGTGMSILATPAPGYTFSGWAGSLTSMANPLVFSMNQSYSITAHFTANYTTNGTPHWWLIAFGLTNRAWDVEAGDDWDKDGLSARAEFEADTIPTNSSSCLGVTGLRLRNEKVMIDWRGGVQSTQVVERASDLLGSPSDWTQIFTNIPPTTTETNIVDGGSGRGPLFYRIRAKR